MISVGTDIEDISRFRRLLAAKPGILFKLFTKYEWEYASGKDQSQTLAGIWCAKEAVVKAFFNYSSLDIRDIEIQHHQKGAPYVSNIRSFCLYQDFDISISISHTKTYATATCIVQKVC